MGDAVIFQGPVVLNSSLLQELKEEALSASACFYFKNTQLCVFVSRVRFSLFSVSSTGTWDIKGGTTEADSSGNWSPVRGALLPTPLPWKPGVRSAPPTLTSNLMPIGLREVFPPTIGFILFYVGWGGDFIFPPRFCWIFFQRALALHRIASPLALCFWFGRCGQQRIKLKSRQAWSNNVLPGLCFFFCFFSWPRNVFTWCSPCMLSSAILFYMYNHKLLQSFNFNCFISKLLESPLDVD